VPAAPLVPAKVVLVPGDHDRELVRMFVQTTATPEFQEALQLPGRRSTPQHHRSGGRETDASVTPVAGPVEQRGAEEERLDPVAWSSLVQRTEQPGEGGAAVPGVGQLVERFRAGNAVDHLAGQR